MRRCATARLIALIGYALPTVAFIGCTGDPDSTAGTGKGGDAAATSGDGGSATSGGLAGSGGAGGAVDPPDPGAAIVGKLTPPAGKTLLIVGQDADTVANYRAAFPELAPAGVTTYTNITPGGDPPALGGLTRGNPPDNRVDYGAGVMSTDRMLAESPTSALALGLYLSDAPGCFNTHLMNINSGGYDAEIVEMAAYLRDTKRPVFLRIGYEFDGPWNCYNNEFYKTAYRHIVDILRAEGATNVATVWQSAAWPDPGVAGDFASEFDHRRPDHLDRWYPGDDVVDWVGVSVFYRDLSRWNYMPPYSPVEAQDKLLAFARAHAKPVMIAESAPQGFDLGALTASAIQKNEPSPTSAAEIWDAWYRPYFDFIHQNADAIRAVAYIDTNWSSQRLWQCAPGAAAGTAGCSQGYWGDSRVEANPDIKARWLAEVGTGFWLHGSTDLFKSLHGFE